MESGVKCVLTDLGPGNTQGSNTEAERIHRGKSAPSESWSACKNTEEQNQLLAQAQ